MRRVLIVLMALSVVVTGCGDDDEEATETPASTTVAGHADDGHTHETAHIDEPATTSGDAPPVALSGKVNDHGTGQFFGEELEMEADDFYFAPTYVTAGQGAAGTVKVRNEGDAAHTFTITSLGIDVEVPAGEEKEFDVQLPESGTIEFVCRFHEAQGMRGAFSIQGS